ncbi:polyphosphate--glucose phosphotransferase [Oleiharenicola lentus]|uniref:polyphosphate--glucose phosphotransferase n=1 Tax=Oleiharenicola lentus TaxID=2508720 RepID=UPI003F66B368
MNVLGIDIGGSAFKGAPVDTKTGKLLAERHRVEIDAPCPTAQGLAAAKAIAKHFDWKGPIGIGFPGIILGDKIDAVGNLGTNWEKTNGAAIFRKATGCKVGLSNDADAAGLAEMRFGAGKGHQGSVLMLTFGTGIGSALFYRGQLLPNIEFGHIPWHRSQPIEKYASAAVRQRRNLSWEEWVVRVNVFLKVAERLCSPELIIVGGGVSKKADKWLQFIEAKAKVVPAKMNNDAGIVGAALAWENSAR